MEQAKRFGAGALASVLMVSMLQSMVFAADTTSDRQRITGFVQAGQEIGEVSFTLGQAESELTAQMPQTITVSAEDGSEEQLPVTWTTQADYANTDDFYYEFVPQWDTDTYDVAPEAEVPYILAQRTDETVVEADGSRSMNVNASGANATAIFKFLINNMSYSSAAACGVLANIKAESDFNPNCYGDNGTSYGICQWHNSRFTALKNWCSQNGYDYTTLNGQLYYLKKELSANNDSYLYNGKTINNKMLTYSASADNAYNAGYYWCYYYEVPAKRESVAKSRGNVAKNTYWPEFGNSSNNSTSVSSVFSDVSSSAWYKNSVQFVYDRKIMNGTSKTTFEPNNALTRAMIAQVLYANAGKPSVSGTVPFKDVSSSAWYYNAVRWAYKNKIMSGMSSTKFAPNDSLTHEQLAVVLHNHAGKPSGGSMPNYSDAKKVSSWAKNAVKWANGKGLLGYISLEGANSYGPQKAALRSETAYNMYKYLG